MLRLAHRIGHRGTVLLFYAMLDLVYGLSLATPPREAAQSPTLAFIAHVLPLPVWAIIWSGVGLVLLVGAFQRFDRWAFSVAVALKTLWGLTFLLGWLLTGLDRGWVAAAIWLAMALLIFVISTWPEPAPPNGYRR